MTKTVLGIFADRDSAEEAVFKLKAEGYNPKDISIVMKDKQEGEILAEDTGTDVVGGALTGATTGAIVGGLAGLLASTFIPGLGAFFIGGPLAAALGLTGAAASTASGAATGALAGGLLGALTGLGLSEDEAKDYEEKIREGGILLAVPARMGDDAQVEQILADSGAHDIKSVSANEARMEERNLSTEDFDSTEEERYRPSHYTYAGAKGGQASGTSKGKSKGKGKGRGWHGDPEGHAIAGKGEDVPGRGEGK